MTDRELDVAILGAGPAGLSAAARAAQRELTHIVLEAAARHANTIQQYQHRKHVMAEPGVLPLRSDIQFTAGRREEILEKWEQAIHGSNIQIRYGSEVTAIAGGQGQGFDVSLKCGTRFRARNLILALGTQGNARRLGVPGDDLPCVQAHLEDPDAHHDETIVIVGAGDAAIENAIALAARNRVVLVNRRSDFPRAKEGNLARITRALETAQLECVFNAEVAAVEQHPPDSPWPLRVILRSGETERTIACHRVITRLGAVPSRHFVEGLGVRFVNDQPDALPELSPRYESSVSGLFIVGALAGSALIKQAMNQGYEVIEHLSGNAVEPADHPVLAAKLRPLIGEGSVDTALEKIKATARAFGTLKPLALREAMMASRVFRVRKGRRLFARGDYPSGVFHVIEGHVRLEPDSGPAMLLRPGQLFGEISLITGRPEELTAVAATDALILETTHSALRRLTRAEPSVREYIDRVFILRALRVLLLPHARPESIHEVSQGAQIHTVAAGTTLFRQGDAIDRLYLVRRGSIALSRSSEQGDVPVAYCGAGSFVDVAGCAGAGTVRTVTARATVAVEALSIDRAAFMRMLENDETLQKKVQGEQAQQVAGSARLHAQPEAGNLLSFFLSHGVGEATNVLVIDELKCIGCDQCETACATTHQGVSRLNRRAGPSFNTLHLPTSCRHCEHPHCMRDCPPNAIHRLPNGEVFIADTCIGCGNCEENCPYGVIQMAEVPPRRGLLQRLLGQASTELAKTAVKCDMCTNLRAGPACVRACPTGAAIRIHAEDIVELVRARPPVAR